MQYQPLVDTLPTLGTHATNVWYTHYQALVAGPFVCILNIRNPRKNRDKISLIFPTYSF